MDGHGRHGSEKKEHWLRRQAVQLSGQLPDDLNDARAVIELMKELVDGFMTPPSKQRGRPQLHVVTPENSQKTD